MATTGLIAALALPVTPATGAPCTVDTIGVHASLANTSGGAILGEAIGQSFVATDTLIDFLRVWRVPEQYNNVIGMHLYITEMEPSGYPDLGRIVLDGPTLVVPHGDGVNPIEFKWTWDPPFALPHRGSFAFFVMQNPCIAFWDILVQEGRDYYPDGNEWATGRSSCYLHAGLSRGGYPCCDLAFQIGFCRDATTPTRRQTWGKLKLLHR